jgi:hypothetical protein
MPRKHKLTPDDPEESKRFVEVARQLESDETGTAFERAFLTIARHKMSKPIKAEAKAKERKA